MKKKMKTKSKNSKKTTKNKGEITKEMTFAEVMQKNPEAGEVLLKNGMHCFGCHMAMYETIEQGARAHGLNPEKLIKQLNEQK